MTDAEFKAALLEVLENIDIASGRIDFQLSRIADVLEEAAGWSTDEEG